MSYGKVNKTTGDRIPYAGNAAAISPIAENISYDNTDSRLSDNNVQDAIDTLANDSSTFVGTSAQWASLTTAQKKSYKYRLLTDDYTDASIGNLSALTTTDKSSLVGAINEVKDGLTVQTTSIDTPRAVGTAYKMGNIISININNGGFFSADPEDVLFTLPEGYRPNAEISILNGINNKQRITLNANGNVVAKETFTNTYVRFCVTFFKM